MRDLRERTCRFRRAAPIALFAIAVFASPSFPQAGLLDTGFGGGYVTDPGCDFHSYVDRIAVDSLARPILVGRDAAWVICRYAADGSGLDTGFGTNGNGKVVLFPGINGDAYDVEVDGSDRILVAGYQGNPKEFTVVRLLSGGTRDTSFGGDGIVTTDFGGSEATANAVVVQPDGKIVVAGTIWDRSGYGAYGLARYNDDGSLDTVSFGPPDKKGQRPGYFIDDPTKHQHDYLFAGILALQSDGKILVGGNVGRYPTGTYVEGWTLTRYGSDGTLDTSFGSAGRLDLASYGPLDFMQIRGIAILSDGRIVAGGRGRIAITHDFQAIAMRYTVDGAIDTSFNNGSGLAISGISQTHGTNIAIQSDGGILIGGGYGGEGIFAFRWNADGTVDTSFGLTGTGVSELAGGGVSNFCCGLALDPAGGIFLHGSNQTGVAKILGASPPTGPPDPPTLLSADAQSSTQVDLTWADNSDDETGFTIERALSPGGAFVQIDTVGVNATTYQDKGLTPSTTYDYRVAAYNAAGPSDWSSILSATTLEGADLATADLPVSGTVSGTYAATHVADNGYQSITERESGGKPSNRHSFLEHLWTFDVTAGTTHVFHLQAYHSPNSEGDDFEFAYSVSASGPWTKMVTVTKTADDNVDQTFFDLPGGLSGTVYVQVIDTDRNQGNRNLDTIYIDHMYFSSQ